MPIKADNFNPLGKRDLLLAAIAASIIAGLPFGAWSQQLAEGSPEILALTGKALWAGIIDAYYRLSASGSLRAGPNDLTPTLEKFIPVGTIMSDAIEVLRAAGFNVENAPPEITLRPGLQIQNQCLVAATGKIPLGFPQRLFTESDVFIVLGYHGIQINAGRVSTVKCTIVYTTL